jgi:hypothetical protein
VSSAAPSSVLSTIKFWRCVAEYRQPMRSVVVLPASCGFPSLPRTPSSSRSPFQDNFECRMRASRRRTQRAFTGRANVPDSSQSKAF